MSVRVRFAPSPTGLLHVGNVRTALYNWLFARQRNGTFVLRIEDTDAARSEQSFEDQLYSDLLWLGLSWDEGPGREGSFGPYRQTQRFHLYQDEARRLLERGNAYYCFCSPEELENHRQQQLADGRQPVYSGKCRQFHRQDSEARREAGEASTLRFRVRDGQVHFEDQVFGRVEVDAVSIGDFILLRSDGSPQYNFAVVVDDFLMEISHVIRGEGHLPNTHKQILIYEALGRNPPQFAHLSTIRGADGAKLSKRHGATSIQEFRDNGYLPEPLVNYLALLGWSPPEDGQEIQSMEGLTRLFDLKRVHRSPAIFDQDKLNWVSRSHLKRLSGRELAQQWLPILQEQGRVSADPSQDVLEWVGELGLLFLNYADQLRDLTASASLVFEFDASRASQIPEVNEILSAPVSRTVIECFCELLEKRSELSFKELVSLVKKETGCKGKDLFHPIRIALTGQTTGPSLDALVQLLERGEDLRLPSPVLGPLARVKAIREQLP